MKRLIVLLAMAGGAAFWWRRNKRQADTWQTNGGEAAGAFRGEQDSPKLGGDVDQELLDILACPVDKQPVTREGNFLVCSDCKRHYPIREGIPVMLVDEALTPEAAATAT